MRPPLSCLCLLALGCGGGEPAGSGPDTPLVLRHDFGVIPHGDKALHEFTVDLPRDAGPLVPLNYTGDCSCTSYEIVLRDRNGEERAVPGFRQAQYAVGPDEELVLRLWVDTSRKEAVDLPEVTSRGTLRLQDSEGRNPPVEVGVILTYAIDAPVTLVPAAHLEFPAMPRGHHLTLPLELHSDGAHTIRFGPVHTSDDRLLAELTPEDGLTVLEATFIPRPDDPAGTFSGLITVETDFDGYRLDIPVSARVIPDIVVMPQAKISLGRFDFSKPGAEDWVTVTDNIREEPRLSVYALRDQEGNDASGHFSVRLETLDGEPETVRVFLRYTGGLEPPHFRGQLILTEDGDQGPFVSIELVAFHVQQP